MEELIHIHFQRTTGQPIAWNIEGPDRKTNPDFEIDDCCGSDLDYWAEDFTENETEDN